MSIQSDVIILFGGTSSERMVSVASAQHLTTILPEAALWFWRPDGGVIAVDASALLAHQNAYTAEFIPAKFQNIATSVEACLDQVRDKVVYLGLHGGDGENGWLQEKLETRRIAFTGSSSASSSLAMNKSKSKDAVSARGVVTARQYLFTPALADGGEELADFHSSVNEIVIKPACEGSSAGLAFIKTQQERIDWFAKNKASNDLWLVEERIYGRELTVGVMMHNGCLTVLPPSEVILERNAHFDYQGKYLGVGNKEITPAEITIHETVAAQSVAVLAHSALNCFGYTRTDMIMTPKGMYYLETNTLPGMTKASFIPQQLSAAGVDLRLFVEGQIALARKRYGSIKLM